MTRDQAIRFEVLTQLNAVGIVIALSVERLFKQSRQAGLDYSRDELLRGAVFLKEQGFVEQIGDEATGVFTFKINSKGVLHCEQNGIA